jgi:cation diffusion facilitator CzcD-associated flavoprotein CzcO
MGADYKIAILGAGLAGIGMGLKLKAKGETSFVILEKAGRVGGVWRENTYPGCACDIPSHLYSYSFELNPDWPEAWSQQPVILDYIERVVARRGLDEHLRFNAEVMDATWDATEGFWRITTADGAVLTAQAFVAAWGQLNRPKLPPIPNRDAFEGVAFHSAQWRHDVSLEGKRVAVIGNGASAIQFVPHVARQAAELIAFQRSPAWIMPRLRAPYTDEQKAAFRADEAAMRKLRAEFFDASEDRLEARRAGHPLPDMWDPIAHIAAQVPDPELRAKLTPTYEIGCKRVLGSSDYYPAITGPNAELVTDAIARMTPQGPVDATGRLHEVDVIIYATGFDTNTFAGVETISGAGGVTLSQAWADIPHAYYGVTVSGFPNFFMLYGPNTNLGHNSIIYMIEAQADYVIQALEALDRHGARALDVRQDVMDAFNAKLQADLQNTPWAGDCMSWYKTADGRIPNNWSGSARQYAGAIARFDAENYRFIPTRTPEPAE